MSLYDKASLIFSGAAGAGNDEVAYNIKPVEKLKVDELVENGSFDDDSAWTKNTGVTISGGKANFSGSDYKSISQRYIFEAGKTYKISLEADITEGGFVAGTNLNESKVIKISDVDANGSGKYSVYYTALEGEDKLVIKRGRSPYDFTIDNVSVREVEQEAKDLSFVRASDLTATHEGPDGLIKKTRENLLTHSNDFSVGLANGGWGKSADGVHTHGAVVSAATITGYDGSTNTWKFLALEDGDTDALECHIRQEPNTSGVQTFSVYAKAGNVNYMRLLANSGGSNPNAFFELTGSGAVTYSNNVVDKKIEKIGSSDWYRCSITFDKSITQTRIQIADGNGNSDGFEASRKVDEGDFIYIQSAQLEQGLAATPYIHRTDSYSKSTAGIQEDEPRYDYSLDNDAPPALLYEPYSGNKIKYSEYFEGTGWSATAEGDGVVPTITTNYAVSPDGSKNAARLQLDLGGGTTADDRSRIQYSAGTYGSGFQTNSLYVKSNSGTVTVFIRTIDQIEVVSVGTDWTRVSASHSNPSGYFEFGIDGFRCPNDTVDLCIWGAQVENLNHTTSYIPTHGSIGTRSADVIPQYVVPKLNLDKYTFFVHSHTDRVVSDNRGPRLSGGSGSSALMGHFITGSPSLKKQFFLYENDGTSALSKATFGSFEAGDETKYAFVVDNIALEAKLFVDGALRETISLSGRVDAKQVSIGNSSGNPDRIKSIMYFPEALEDADVVSLTT